MRDPATHSRRSIRLPNFDYSDSAAYFVTLVTRDRAELFGRIADDVMHFSSIGEIVREEWLRSSDIREELELTEFVVMPNHLHGVVIIEKEMLTCEVSAPSPAGAHSRAPLRRAPRSLGSFISGFKATTTRLAKQSGMVPDAPIWQRNYFDRVIRNEYEADRIRQYIIDNPSRWSEDPENGGRTPL